MFNIGVWEAGKFIGSICFGTGAGAVTKGSTYGLPEMSMAELVRVALTYHANQVSRILSIAIKLLKKNSPKLRLLISFSDPAQGHHGGIYQATGWIYSGCSSPATYIKLPNGQLIHCRGFNPGKWTKKKRIPKGATKIVMPGKHRYLMPLDDAMRRQIEPLRKPYPKRAGSIENDAAAVQAAEGGANPTPALQVTAGLPSAAPAARAAV